MQDEDERVVQGRERTRNLHAGLGEHLTANDFDVEHDSSDRSMEWLAKSEWVGPEDD